MIAILVNENDKSSSKQDILELGQGALTADTVSSSL